MSNGFQKSKFPNANASAASSAAAASGVKAGESTRRTPRRVFLRPVGLLRRGEFCLVQALQLSEGGMLFQSPEKFAVGEAIVLSIIVPGGASVVVRGEVVYTKPSQNPKELSYGVKFAPLTLPLRRLIRIYVTAKTRAEAEAEVYDA